MNFNTYFKNILRSDLIGYNMSTVTVDRKAVNSDNSKWYTPTFSLQGILCLGHQTEINNVLSLSIYEENKILDFSVKRHTWTPAFCETYYRCSPDTDYYEKSGCISVKEKKCITGDDVFVSEITIRNDKKESARLKTEFSTPLKKSEENVFLFKSKVLAGALQKNFEISGYFFFYGCGFSEEIEILPGKSYTFKYFFAFDKYARKAKEKVLCECKKDSFSENEKRVNEWFFKNVPILKTQNKELEKIYYYRFLLIYINSFSPSDIIPDHYIKNEVMYENRYGTWYGCPVTLPLPLQVSEAKWLNENELAKRQIDLWKSENLCMSYIQYTPFSVWDYYLKNKDKKWLSGVYDFCKKFTMEKYSENDLPVMEGSWNTGAEYQPSFYQWTTPKWDWHQDYECAKSCNLKINKLYRLDEICYFLANLKACAFIAAELENKEEHNYFESLFEKYVKELEEKFWNNRDKMFYDIDYKTKKQCDEAACYDSYAPFLFDIINDEKYFECFDKIFDDEWFSDEFGITTVAKNCKMYWFDNCITDGYGADIKNPHEYGCGWNGPIWPYAMSLVLNAFGKAAMKSSVYKEKWLELFEKYNELHFYNGDRSVPCVFEHYRPGDGMSFSSSCDYFHSVWIDLFMKYWAGIGIENENITFFPFTNEEFEIENIHINGEYYKFVQSYEDDVLKSKYIKVTKE